MGARSCYSRQLCKESEAGNSHRSIRRENGRGWNTIHAGRPYSQNRGVFLEEGASFGSFSAVCVAKSSRVFNDYMWNPAHGPAKATVESVLPGVHQQFTNLYTEINRVRLAIAELKAEAAGAASIDGEKEACCCVLFLLVFSHSLSLFSFLYSAPNEGAFGRVVVASE